MTIRRYDDFNAELERIGNRPDAIPYETFDGNNRPVPVGGPTPGGRLSRRALPTPSRAIDVGLAIDAACALRNELPESFLYYAGGFLEVFPPIRRFRDFQLRLLCGPSAVGNPPVAQPFQGGRCDFSYVVQVISRRYRRAVTCVLVEPPSNNQANFWGPIAGVRLGPPDGPFKNSQILVTCFGSASSPRLTSPAEVGLGVVSNAFADCPDPYIVAVNVSPVGGVADTCGDPPTETIRREGDRPTPILPDLSIDIQLGDNATLNVPVSFGFDVNNNINLSFDGVDVTFDGGNIDIQFGDTNNFPTLDLDDCPPCGSISPIDPDPIDVPPPPPAGDDPITDEPTDPDPEQVIRAVLVTVTGPTPAVTQLSQIENPDVLIPDAGLVSFRIRATDGSTGWTPDYRVKNRRCFIQCDWPLGAIDVRGTPRPGVTWEITPIREALPVE